VGHRQVDLYGQRTFETDGIFGQATPTLVAVLER
jgi:hypothetical protein